MKHRGGGGILYKQNMTLFLIVKTYFRLVHDLLALELHIRVFAVINLLGCSCALPINQSNMIKDVLLKWIVWIKYR